MYSVLQNYSPPWTTFAHHTFLFFVCKKDLNYVSFSFHFTIMNHFVLVYHKKSKKCVVKMWQNVEKFKGGEYFCKAL